MDARRALVELGGIGSAQDIAALSSRKRLRGAVRRGDVVRISRGRYCLPHAATAYGDAQANGAYLSHLSAALHHGWAVRMPPHRTMLVTDLPPQDRAGWATSPLRTIRDCAETLPFADGLSVADSALRAGAFTHEELVQQSRRWAPPARRVAALANGRSANPFESSLRALAIQAGLRAVPQWAVEVAGTTLHPDVADPWAGLALEADSWGHHAQARRDHDVDCSRYNLLVVAGWRVLRFTWPQVMFDQAEVEKVLRWATTDGPASATPRPTGVSAA